MYNLHFRILNKKEKIKKEFKEIIEELNKMGNQNLSKKVVNFFIDTMEFLNDKQ